MNKTTWALLSIVIIGLILIFNPLRPLFPKTFELKTVAHRTIVTLQPNFNQKNIHGIQIDIYGYLNGEATLHQSNEQGVIRIHELKSGETSIKLGGDWYSPLCILEYEPHDVTEGYLTIKYKFLGL